MEATSGRLSSNLDTNISCSIKVGDAVSFLGNYIKYVVDKTPCVDEEASNQSGTKNALVWQQTTLVEFIMKFMMRFS